MEDLEIIKYYIIITFISIFTLRLNYKLLDIYDRNIKNILKTIFLLIVGDIITTIVGKIANSTISIIFFDMYIAYIFSDKINKNIGYSLLVTTMSLCINFILYLISTVINFILFNIIHINNDYVILASILIVFMILFKKVYHIKRLKNGLTFLKNNENNKYLELLILNISATLFLAITILSNVEIRAKRSIFVYTIIFSTIMFIIIYKSLQLYYKQKLQEREVEEIKEELKNREKEIKELENENLKLNKKNHSIAHKQKSLEYELKQLLANNQIINKNNIKDKIEDLSKEMQNETISVELAKTNIEEIDSMLKYMQSECMKNKIDFQLQLNGNIHHMVNTYIEKEDLEILIADMIKNALIAINNSKNINKGILVRLGLIDGKYSLYIYDSGIEFEIDTLINLGIKPSTTHSNDGGTGMGWMNTFDTLKKYKASLVIDEYGKPVEDNFTKVINIIFDNENTYKINSYREKEIKKEDSENRINLINRLYK